MTERELSHNLLSAYMLLKAANENLKTIYEFRGRIDNKEFIEIVKNTKPKISHFVNTIDHTLIASPRFRTKDFALMEENCMVLLESLDQEIKTF